MKGNDMMTTTVVDSATAAACVSALSTSPGTASTATSGNFRHEHGDNIADVAVECPLCMENLEIDDLDFFPCSCGYQVCRFCWHRLKNDENGLCPACRQLYPDSPIHFSSISIERVEELKKQKKKQKEKQKLKESNKANLSTIRVVQKNLLFVIGFSQRLSQDDLRKEFTKYGKIVKMVINSSSAYVTYTKAEDAVAAIKSLNELSLSVNGGIGKNGTVKNSTASSAAAAAAAAAAASVNPGISSIRASLGTTKYCTHWLRSQTCPKQPDCMYLHEVADQEASFTKEEMQLGKHTEYEKRLITYYLDVIAKEKELKEPKPPSISNGTTPILSQTIVNSSITLPKSITTNLNNSSSSNSCNELGTSPSAHRTWSNNNMSSSNHNSTNNSVHSSSNYYHSEESTTGASSKVAKSSNSVISSSSSSSTSLFSSSTTSTSSPNSSSTTSQLRNVSKSGVSSSYNNKKNISTSSSSYSTDTSSDTMYQSGLKQQQQNTSIVSNGPNHIHINANGGNNKEMVRKKVLFSIVNRRHAEFQYGSFSKPKPSIGGGGTGGSGSGGGQACNTRQRSPDNLGTSKWIANQQQREKLLQGGKSSASIKISPGKGSSSKGQSQQQQQNDSDSSSSGASSLSCTPNQTDHHPSQSSIASGIFSYCSSSSSSSGTSSLNLCDSSDSGNCSAGSSSGGNSNSSTPDNIQKAAQQNAVDATNGANLNQQQKQQQTTNQCNVDVNVDSLDTAAPVDVLLQDEDDDLDFDPISFSSRALEDMLRTMTMPGNGAGGVQSNGLSSGLGAPSSDLFGGPFASFGQPSNSSRAFGLGGSPLHQPFGSLQPQPSQAPMRDSMSDLLAALGALDTPSCNTFLPTSPSKQAFSNSNQQQQNGSNFLNFSTMQQQQQRMQHQPQANPSPNSAPPTAASLLHQQQLLQQLQELQSTRNQIDLQQQKFHLSEKNSNSNLFGNAFSNCSSPLHHPHQAQSPQMYHQSHHQQQHSPQSPSGNGGAKLWQQNSLRQLLPNVNIKFQHPNGQEVLLDSVDAAFGIGGPFGPNSSGLSHPGQPLSPSALNVAAVASFFGGGGSNVSSRPHPMQANSPLMNSANNNSSPFWQAPPTLPPPGHHSPPSQNGSSHLLQQQQFLQQQQMLRMQQQQRQVPPPPQASNNSFFMNQFQMATNQNNQINRPPPGF